jgi:PPOX class probable F420-dependent enzyme
MDIAHAQQFLREHENAVLATWRRDGRLHMSPVTVGLDGAGRAIISSQETTAKVRNLRRDPRAALCVFVEAFRGPWIQMAGTAEVVTVPDALEPLVDYYHRLAREHPDWDDYRRAMMADRRALIRITIERAGPDRQGEGNRRVMVDARARARTRWCASGVSDHIRRRCGEGAVRPVQVSHPFVVCCGGREQLRIGQTPSRVGQTSC